MAKYKVMYHIADYYGQPKSLWKRGWKTITIKIAGNPTYEAKNAILMKLGKTPNWGIEIGKIKEV